MNSLSAGGGSYLRSSVERRRLLHFSLLEFRRRTASQQTVRYFRDIFHQAGDKASKIDTRAEQSASQKLICIPDSLPDKHNSRIVCRKKLLLLYLGAELS
jgi:hypothetical protein